MPRVRPPLRPPVLFVGVPRSGTTIAFDVFASHPEVAWLSNYATGAPRLPVLNVVRRLARHRPFDRVARRWPVRGEGLARLGIRPSEAYPFWAAHAHPDFARSYLLHQRATPEVAEGARAALAAVCRWQGRPVFAAKITGPARIAFLDSLFPDARFVHVVRDPRAVVRSLLEVPFWREGGGLTRPWWTGLPPERQAAVEAEAGDPAALAAAQWAAIVGAAAEEAARWAPGRVFDLRYESFAADPHRVTRELLAFAGLEDVPEVHRFLDERVSVGSRNDKFRSGLTEQQVRAVERAAGPALQAWGYTPDRG